MPALAEAFVRIRPDTSSFGRDTERELNRAGQSGGRAFRDGLGQGGGLLGGAGENLRNALNGTDLEGAGRNAGGSFRRGFEGGGGLLDGAADRLRGGLGGVDLSGEGGRAGQSFGDGFSRDAAGRLRDARGRFASEVDVDLSGVGSRLGQDLGEGFTRDALGRLRDARGRFATEVGGGPPLRTPPVEVPPIERPRIPDPEPARGKVDVDVEGARTAVIGLAMDMARLAAIPVGATLAVGLGGIATAAAAAGAGMGALAAVAMPAISRVTEALEAQKQAEEQSTAASGASATQAISLANARQALAAALRNQEYAHEQAVRGVENAERALADAQRGAVDAQRELADAREAAAQRLADLRDQIEAGQLSLRGDEMAVERARAALERLNDTRQDELALRRADIGLREAQARLQEVLADPESTQLEKDRAQLAVDSAQAEVDAARERAKNREQEKKEAQLAYDQAVARYKKQQEDLKDLAEEERKTAKAGLDGSTEVLEARQRLADANRQVADSERALADARANVARTDQQSADSVASARRGLRAAMLAGANATKAQVDALAELTPAERALATDIVGLQGSWEKWQQAMQPKVLPLVSQGIGILRGQIGNLTPFVEGATGAVGGLLTRLGNAAQSDGFKQFLDDLAEQTPGAITAIGNSIGNLVVGFGRLFQAFLPYAPQVLGFIEDMTARFRTWAESQATDGESGFQQFLDWVQANGANIGQQLADIGRAAQDLATALAPLAGATGLGMLNTFGLIARAISGLSPGEIQALAIAFVAVRTAMAGYQVAKTAADGIGAVRTAMAAGADGPAWARALNSAWTGMQNLGRGAADAARNLWAQSRAAAASAAATARAKVAAAGAWLSGMAQAAGAAAAALWNQSRAAGAAALATARVKLAAAGAWLVTMAQAAGAAALAFSRQAISTAAATAAQLAARGAAIAWTAAQWLLNVALNANPIGLIVLAIAALVTAFVLAYRNSETFRNIVQAAWQGIQTAVSAAWNFIQPIFAAIGNFLINTLGAAFTWLWNSVIQPAWAGIGQLISAAWTGVIQPALNAVWGFITNTLAPVFVWLWNNVISPAFEGIGQLIGAAWNGVIQPIFQAVWNFISNTLAPVFRWLWNNVVAPVFAGIGELIRAAWTGVIQPIFQAVWNFISNVLGPVFNWLWNTIIQPVFGFIGKFISDTWTILVRPIFQAIWNFITNTLGPVFTWLWENAIKPAWDFIKDAIQTGWNNVIKPVFDLLKTAVDSMGGAFETGANAIKAAWDKIQEYAKVPVNFVIGTVYNKGIVGLWNKVIDWLKLPGGMKLGEIDMLERGGTLTNPAKAAPMKTNGPMAIVGEGRRQFPEFVIPTDPKYRGRAQNLWASAGRSLQMLEAGGSLGGGRVQMLEPGGVLGAAGGLWDGVKDIAGGVVDLVDDALELLADPKGVWDKLVDAIPKPDWDFGMWGQAIAAIPNRLTDAAWTSAKALIDKFNEGFGGKNGDVLAAAAKYVGVGDDRGRDNNNPFTRRYGYPPGTEWCALFVSAAIEDAKANARYPGSPSAMVAAYNGAMRHIPVGLGKPGDLATYGANAHINIIEEKIGPATYRTIGGNEGPLVKRGTRVNPATVLRPLATGGTLGPLSEVMKQTPWDPRDRRDPGTRWLREAAPLFDSGGLLPPGPNNATGKPEPVLTQQQWAALMTLAARGAEPRGPIFGDVYPREEVDIDILMSRAEFAIRSSGI